MDVRANKSRWISIHAPREGSDDRVAGSVSLVQISIHAPREGSDLSWYADSAAAQLFLSTLPARGATLAVREATAFSRISIHAPREGSDGIRQPGACRHPHFYPRSPRGERLVPLYDEEDGALFLSTLPARGATLVVWGQCRRSAISIHAPREGSDCLTNRPRRWPCGFLSTLPARGATSAHQIQHRANTDFYPRSPRGERLLGE